MKYLEVQWWIVLMFSYVKTVKTKKTVQLQQPVWQTLLLSSRYYYCYYI